MRLEVDSLRWVVGTFCAVLGAMMLVTPRQFATAAYANLGSDLSCWGVGFLLIGPWLVSLALFRPWRPIVFGVHLCVGILLLTLALGAAAVGGWMGAANFGALSLATTLAPLVSDPATPTTKARRAELFGLAVGLGAASAGVTILVLPQQFGSPYYDAIRLYLPLFGLAFLASGLALALAEVWVKRAGLLYCPAHVAAGATFLAFCAASSVPLHAWPSVAYYGGFGAAVALMPWLRGRLADVGPASLRVRLSFALAVAASLPAILMVGLVEDILSGGPLGSSAGDQGNELLLVALLAQIAAAGMVGMYVARWLTAPLQALGWAARRLPTGDASAPLPASTVAEIADLQTSFAEMRDRLAARTAEHERLLTQVEEARERAERAAAEARRLADDRAVDLARAGTLLRVSQAVLAETSIAGLLRRVAEAARETTGAGVAVAGYGYRYRNGAFTVEASFQNDGLPPGSTGGVLKIARGGVYLDLLDGKPSLRLTDDELRRHPRWWGLPPAHCEVRGLVGASMPGRDGQVAGVLMASDKRQGDFTAEDEAALVQLAAVASLGLQNVEARADAERRARELDATLDSMTDAVLVYDTGGLVVKANPAAQAIVGSNGIGRTAAWMFTEFAGRDADGRPVAVHDAPSTRALRGERVEGERLFFKDSSGQEHAVLCAASPLLLGGEVCGAVVLWHDITDLTELDRLKDQFIGVAAHELKTPLTIMKGYAEALLRLHDNLPPQAGRMLEAIDRGADRINAIVQDLLDVSKLQTGRLELASERVDLGDLVQQVVDRFGLTTARHHLRVADAEPAIVWGDRYRLEQVTEHLLENAVKHSPKGGEVRVAVLAEQGEAVVSVKDQGVGIPQEKQEHIFERFYRAHTRTPYDFGGMGTGLYISREIITRHGGRMWFQSEEGKGSTFYFSLPLGGGGSDSGE